MVAQADKLPHELRRLLKDNPVLAIAFSGGLDSRFLCHAARLCGCDIVAIHASGPHIPQAESAYALAWAKENAVDAHVVEYDPLLDSGIASNGRDRCYQCKKKLFRLLANYGRRVADGTNAGDLSLFRPGLLALKEENVFSPLALAGLDKKAIRSLALATGLENHGQKARPCLLTRFAYGMRPGMRELRSVERAENELANILGNEVDFRLRLTPDPVLQIQDFNQELLPKIDSILKKYGFGGYSLAIANSISGYFDGLTQKIRYP